MKYEFKYYLHDSGEREEQVNDLVSREGMPQGIAEQIVQARPFYEVELHCSYDSATGKVEYVANSPGLIVTYEHRS